MENKINNKIYQELGARWYSAEDDPVALLRAESRFRNPWILKTIQSAQPNSHVLDLGCGGGFLANALAKKNHRVVGIDLSDDALAVAKQHDTTKSVSYIKADAYSLPFANNSFDVICTMDFLEHIEHPKKMIQQISCLLRPGGLFFFHTFNRNAVANLIIIKGVEWFVKNTPKNLHVIDLFIRPKELIKIMNSSGLNLRELTGVRPEFLNRDFIKMLVTGQVGSNFKFKRTKSLLTGYMGYSQKSETL